LSTDPADGWVVLICPAGAQDGKISHGDREFAPYREDVENPRSRWARSGPAGRGRVSSVPGRRVFAARGTITRSRADRRRVAFQPVRSGALRYRRQRLARLEGLPSKQLFRRSELSSPATGGGLFPPPSARRTRSGLMRAARSAGCTVMARRPRRSAQRCNEAR
jgi:hypothetical protein